MVIFIGVILANEEHLAILKQGVKVWNEWRNNNPSTVPNLHGAYLNGANLNSANLIDANLRDAYLHGANLNSANLNSANLNNANLNNANLRDAHLIGAYLIGANLNSANLQRTYLHRAYIHNANLRDAHLNDANLTGADLNSTDLTGADLTRADLTSADLTGADLTSADLTGARLLGAVCRSTVFSSVDLSEVVGLELIDHTGPSIVGIDTLYVSNGKISEIFLRGCGVPETLITYLPSLMAHAIEFYSCFISYSHADKEFARLLHDRLQGQGIRCWLDEHQLNPGDPLHRTIYEGIRVYDKTILCCSMTSLDSWWVETEYEHGLQKEEEYKAHLIIPVDLDGHILDKESCIGEIPSNIRKRAVADFTDWKSHDSFEAGFQKVLKALRTDGGKPPPPVSKLKKKKA